MSVWFVHIINQLLPSHFEMHLLKYKEFPYVNEAFLPYSKMAANLLFFYMHVN